MSRSTTLVEPAASLDLTTLDRVKRQLDIKETTTEHDDFLAQIITQCSGRADRYCERIFARQKYSDEFTICGSSLRLANPPVDEVVVTQGGATLAEGTAYRLDKAKGIVWMLRVTRPLSLDVNATIVVEYQGGFIAPPSTAPGSLFRDAAQVEDAVIRLVMAGFKAKGRDPLLKSHDQGATLGRREWWVGAPPSTGGMPSEIAGLLDDFWLGSFG